MREKKNYRHIQAYGISHFPLKNFKSFINFKLVSFLFICYWMCVSVLSACMSMWHVCAELTELKEGVRSERTGVIQPLQAVVSCQVGAGDPTLVLWKCS